MVKGQRLHDCGYLMLIGKSHKAIQVRVKNKGHGQDGEYEKMKQMTNEINEYMASLKDK